MSRPVLTAAMLLLVSNAAAAQPAPQEVMQRQRALLDSLRPRLVELRELVRIEASVRRAEAEREWESTVLDTLRLGPLRVIGVPVEVARRRNLLEDVWSEQQHLFTGLEEALAGETIVLTHGLPTRMRTLYRSRQHHELPLGSLWVDRHRPATEATITRLIIKLMPDSVRRWMTNELPPYDVPDEEVYRRLTLLGSSRAQACLAGDLKACAAVLGLDGSDPHDLYTPVELARIAARRSTAAVEDAQIDVCRDGDLSACRAVLERYHAVAPGAGGRAHVHFLGYAMAAAEPGMFARLRHERTGTIGERIERAAGVPLTVLLEGWHAAALATPPDSDRHGGRTRFAAVLWVAILATLAGRSTRWRIG